MSSFFWLSAIVGGLFIINSGNIDTYSSVNLSPEKGNPESTLSHDSPRSSSTEMNFQVKISNLFCISHPLPVVRTSQFNYTSHTPVNVTNDDELSKVAISGTGSENDPYILEGWNITTTGVRGISIQNTTAYFIIRNCWITTGNIFDIDGIHIANTAQGTAIIGNNTCYNNINGIFLYNSGNPIVTNNTCTQNQNNGIKLINSENATIVNNRCVENGLNRTEDKLGIWDGISLENSSSSLINNNTCLKTQYTGISLINSAYSTISNNYCTQNELDGIRIASSKYSTVVNNNCTQNKLDGIFLSRNCTNSLIRNNTCTDNKRGISLRRYSGNSSVLNNTCTDNGEFGISISDSGSSTIVNNICNENNFQAVGRGFGVFLEFSSYSSILNNTCSDNRGDGIGIWYSDNSPVVNNTCNQNVGVEAWNGNGIGFWYSWGASIMNNKCSQNEKDGILVGWNPTEGQGLNNENMTMANNFCFKNDRDGIRFESSRNVTIINNFCIQNGRWGIYLRRSNNCSISRNYIEASQDYGVFLDTYCENIQIHHNNFSHNNQGDIQAYDYGNNQWYDPDTREGNYWSDYSGFGDYYIDGFGESIDPYPLFEPMKVRWEEFWRFLVFGDPQIESISDLTTTSSKTRLISLPSFIFFLLSIAILSYSQYKRGLIK